MKTIKLLFLLVSCILFTDCQQTSNTDDKEKIKSVVIEYFNGIETRDYQKLKDLTTSDFLLFEDGRVFNNDSLIKGLSSMPNMKFDYRFEEFVVNVSNDIGYLRYYNLGEFTVNDTTKMSVTFLESATFKKINNVWKMGFLHSTVKK